VLREALDIYAKVPDFESHHLVAATWNNLSYALRGQGRLEESEAAARKSLTLMHAARGDRHSQTAAVMVNVARFEIEHGRFDKAEALLVPALKIRQETFPSNDRRVAVAKNWLGATYTALGRYADAEPLLLDADRNLAAVSDAWAAHKQAVLTHLITLYTAWGKPDQAAPYRARLSRLKVFGKSPNQ
jgi:tetratricopeptide (TPR) repeat protein